MIMMADIAPIPRNMAAIIVRESGTWYILGVPRKGRWLKIGDNETLVHSRIRRTRCTIYHGSHSQHSAINTLTFERFVPCGVKVIVAFKDPFFKGQGLECGR